MTTINTVLDYSRNAAQEFLQTAVFIDDRIYQSESRISSVPMKVINPKRRKKVTKNPEDDTDIASAKIDMEVVEDFSPHDVVLSFAKKQIICSLYQPKKRAKVSPTSDVFPLCRAADIIIVDWDLYGDRGERVLELIDGLITQAVKDVPEQLRLIIVYTQEINLFEIANKLYEKVSAGIGDDFVPMHDDGGLAFQTANSRVSILGKKTGRDRGTNIPADHIVEESKLADAAIQEFSKLASGLLHAATLLGLSKIRQNSRKILSKFNINLDPSFLTHLAMCTPHEDASVHVIQLLVSEIESVLEDVLPSPLLPAQVLSDWCQNEWVPGEHLDNLFGQQGLNVRAIAESICLNGFTAAKQEFSQIPNPGSKIRNTRKAGKILLQSEQDNTNNLFAHLMSSRTFYEDMPKTLKLGTIFYDRRNERYFLCLQPVCDSVRLKKERNFIFVQLTKREPDSNERVSHIVVRQDHEAIELFFEAKAHHSFVTTFMPDKSSEQVLSKKAKDGSIVFYDKSRRRYDWIDELKIAHAQRAVEMFSRDLSRVGLTESEWLRTLGA